jgi:hypothetical protein
MRYFRGEGVTGDACESDLSEMPSVRERCDRSQMPHSMYASVISLSCLALFVLLPSRASNN